MVYEWNAAMAKANRQKHGVSFEEAATVFLDPLAFTFPGSDHSSAEVREITIGSTGRQRIVLVSHCQRGDPHADYQCPKGKQERARAL